MIKHHPHGACVVIQHSIQGNFEEWLAEYRRVDEAGSLRHFGVRRSLVGKVSANGGANGPKRSLVQSLSFGRSGIGNTCDVVIVHFFSGEDLHMIRIGVTGKCYQRNDYRVGEGALLVSARPPVRIAFSAMSIERTQQPWADSLRCCVPARPQLMMVCSHLITKEWIPGKVVPLDPFGLDGQCLCSAAPAVVLDKSKVGEADGALAALGITKTYLGVGEQGAQKRRRTESTLAMVKRSLSKQASRSAGICAEGPAALCAGRADKGAVTAEDKAAPAPTAPTTNDGGVRRGSQGPMELATTIHRSGGCSRTARLPAMFAMLVCPLPAQL